MNSARILNFETRPLKFTERKMLLACFARVCNYFNNDYQYIGFGGLAFTDFKLFHRELNINELVSIEGGDYGVERIEFNSPLSLIKIHNKLSSSALTSIDLFKRTIVWLDYDRTIEDYMFDDITILFNKLPVGSIYIMTCNRKLVDEKTGKNYSAESFREKYGSLGPYDIEGTALATEGNNKIIRRMLLNQIQRVIKDRNLACDSKLEFKQLFNILYQENMGAKMLTFGGLIIDDSIEYEKIGLSEFDFINNDENTTVISIPNLTRRESELIERYLDKKDDLLAKKIISEEEFEAYVKIYKYIPHFHDIRI